MNVETPKLMKLGRFFMPFFKKGDLDAVYRR